MDTNSEVAVRQRAMFGLTLDDFKAANHGSTDFASWEDVLRLSVGLQSDAQEEMALGNLEQARRLLNLSKWCSLHAVDLLQGRC